MRLNAMVQHKITFAALLSLSLLGCGQSDTTPAAPITDAASATAVPAPEAPPGSVPVTTPTPASTAAPAPAAASASRDPQVVVQAWADAVRARNWPAAYLYWGDHGARSGKTLAQFTAQWRALEKPLVVVGKGDQEGAAGSLYYTVPVMISDGTRRISGELVLRRVNDVEGASAEQLRWHIESTTLQP